jgi:hypothetical protein
MSTPTTGPHTGLIGALVAQELLQGRVLRTFTAEELSFGNKTYEIGNITVLDDGIKVELK